jgi:hypothetical protein
MHHVSNWVGHVDQALLDLKAGIMVGVHQYLAEEGIPSIA